MSTVPKRPFVYVPKEVSSKPLLVLGDFVPIEVSFRCQKCGSSNIVDLSALLGEYRINYWEGGALNHGLLGCSSCGDQSFTDIDGLENALRCSYEDIPLIMYEGGDLAQMVIKSRLKSGRPKCEFINVTVKVRV
jgi:hypothetical protein